MLKAPYRLFFNGVEMRAAHRYSYSTLLKKVHSSKKTCVIRVEATYIDEETKEKTTASFEGKYITVGNLRPVMYHVGGDNPLDAPAPVQHKTSHLAPCLGRRIKTTIGTLDSSKNTGVYTVYNDN